MCMKFNKYEELVERSLVGKKHSCVHLQNSKIYSDSSVVIWKKRRNFLRSHCFWKHWKQIHFAEHTFQNAAPVFSKNWEKSLSACRSLFLFPEEVQHSLSIHEVALSGYLPKSSWCPVLRLQAASTESTLRGLQTPHASVRCVEKKKCTENSQQTLSQVCPF